MSSHCATSIQGICNLLGGDEGVGVHAIWHLEENEFPSHVYLLDGDTGRVSPPFRSSRNLITSSSKMQQWRANRRERSMLNSPGSGVISRGLAAHRILASGLWWSQRHCSERPPEALFDHSLSQKHPAEDQRPVSDDQGFARESSRRGYRCSRF